MEKIILASSSERRMELLDQISVPYRIIPADINEDITITNPVKHAEFLEEQKALTIENNYSFDERLILAADTIVAINNKILGKAKNELEAREFIKLLSGDKHEVITAVSLIDTKNKCKETLSIITTVEFGKISKEELDWYIPSKEWKGVAGAYRIQGIASMFINSINGSYSNVMGLPLHAIYGMLLKQKYIFSLK